MQETYNEEGKSLTGAFDVTQNYDDLADVKLVANESQSEAEGEVTSNVITIDAQPSSNNNAPAPSDPNVTTAVPARFIKIEKSLAALGFFTPSSKRLQEQKSKRISMTREVDGKRVEVSTEIIPSALFGLPVTADQDKYLAMQEIITNTLLSKSEVKNPIRFTSAELLRLMHRDTNAGKNYREIGEWLAVMTSTMIRSRDSVYVAGRNQYVTSLFHVFEKTVSVGKEMDDGTVADANYVWLSDWQLGNINNKWLLPIDLETYRELRTHIAKALVPLLQIWLFATKKVGSFEKRYEDLCEILTLRCYRNASQITRQLRPSLDELVQFEYLEKWRIEKTSDRKTYKVIFIPGAKFHRDARQRLKQKRQNDTPIVVAESEAIERSVPEPGRLETPREKPAIHRRPTGTSESDREQPASHIDELCARGLRPSDVLKLLESLPSDRLDHISNYIEYWDAEKQKKDVGPGLLWDLIKTGDPLPPTFETKRQRVQRLSVDERRRKMNHVQEVMESSYEDYRRQAVDRYMSEGLPPGDFDRRVDEYKKEMLGQPGIWSNRPEVAEQFARHAIRAESAKAVTVLPYEEFYRKELPGLLARLKFDPADLGIALDSIEPEYEAISTNQESITPMENVLKSDHMSYITEDETEDVPEEMESSP